MEAFCSDDSWWNEYINFPDDTPDSPPCPSAHDYYDDSLISSSIAGLFYCPGKDEIAPTEVKQQNEMQSMNTSFEPSSPSTSLSSLSSFSSSAASPCSSSSPSLSPSPSPAPSPSPFPLSRLSLEALAVPPKPAVMVLRSCRSSVSPPSVASPCRKGRRATSMPILASADVLASDQMTVPTSNPNLIRSTGCIKTRRLARSRKSPYPVKIAQVESDDDDDSEYVPSSAEDDDYSPPGSPARVHSPSPNSSVTGEEPLLSRKPRSKQERKDVCLKCNQTFTRAADLRRHMKIHQRQSDEEILRDDGEYRIWCKGCHRILARIDARQRHETTCVNYKALPASVRRLDRPRKHQKTRRARF